MWNRTYKRDLCIQQYTYTGDLGLDVVRKTQGSFESVDFGLSRMAMSDSMRGTQCGVVMQVKCSAFE